MVNNITPTVASEDLKLEETLTIVGPNTLLQGVLYMARSVITARRKDITPMLPYQSSLPVFTV